MVSLVVLMVIMMLVHFKQPANLPLLTIGHVDQPVEDTLKGAEFGFSGWALDREGISRVDIVLDGGTRFPVRFGVERPDVRQQYPDYPDSHAAGFETVIDLSPWLIGQHRLEVTATNRQRRKTVLAEKTLIAPKAGQRWQPLLANKPGPLETFYILFSTSGVKLGGANEIAESYALYNSATIKAGFRVPVLYMRTTKGAPRDWIFDPEFDTLRQCGDRRISDDALNEVINFAVKHQLPVLFTLNGGIWGDASCDTPEWDINDHLEQNPLNCQWNEQDQVMADDYLQHLPGSQTSPELARALTLNIYAQEVRSYKKRNLQQAARIIHDFARHYPDLFVGVNVDPDVYINPFFEGKQWYDYNPATRRQFREWLQGKGPYGGRPEAGTPDLSSYRRTHVLSLADVNRLSGGQFKDWDEVDPPRSFPTQPKPYWEDPWMREWELFRRHLVALHYDELSAWLTEAGIKSEQIFSSQGFMAPQGEIMPFPIRLDSPVKNYDAGGLSVEGSVPRNGHLGAILYGASAINDIAMETSETLFEVFRRFDADWAVVEYNTADLRMPHEVPDFAAGYRSLREIFNFGARFVAPMAWNGSNGLFAGQPGFIAYTAVRNTPLEEATKDFMLSHANLPRHARYWGFGAAVLMEADGWFIDGPGRMIARGGYVTLFPVSGQTIMLVARLGGQLEPAFQRLLLLGFQQPQDLEVVTVTVTDFSEQQYAVLARSDAPATLVHDGAGLHVPLDWSQVHFEPNHLRIAVKFRSDAQSATLDHIVLHPG